MGDFNLSNKRIEAIHNDSSQAKYRERDVKEFIFELKKEFRIMLEEYDVAELQIDRDDIDYVINKLAGEKLNG
jgi:hypothetical protein